MIWLAPRFLPGSPAGGVGSGRSWWCLWWRRRRVGEEGTLGIHDFDSRGCGFGRPGSTQPRAAAAGEVAPAWCPRSGAAASRGLALLAAARASAGPRPRPSSSGRRPSGCRRRRVGGGACRRRRVGRLVTSEPAAGTGPGAAAVAAAVAAARSLGSGRRIRMVAAGVGCGPLRRAGGGVVRVSGCAREMGEKTGLGGFTTLIQGRVVLSDPAAPGVLAAGGG
jgi:hypothetical protein